MIWVLSAFVLGAFLGFLMGLQVGFTEGVRNYTLANKPAPPEGPPTTEAPWPPPGGKVLFWRPVTMPVQKKSERQDPA